MIVGRLPFTAPYKDEYMRQRLLQAITKGMSSYHEKEMQTGALTPGKKPLLYPTTPHITADAESMLVNVGPAT